MKKLTLLAVAASAACSFVACSDDPQPPTVVHETRVVNHYHTAPPADNGPDNFQAVERPATYSN